VQVERRENVHFDVMLTWNSACKDNLCPVVSERHAPLGFEITKYEISGNVKNALLRGTPTVEIAPDKKKLIVKGEMVRPSGLLSHLYITPKFHVPIQVTLERRTGGAAKPYQFPMALNVPGQTKIPLPPLSGNWQATKRQIALNLKEGDRSVWSGTDMPSNRPMQLKNRPVILNAAVQDNQVVLTVTDQRAGLPQVGN